MRTTSKIIIASTFAIAATASAASAEKLTLYCSAQEDWCQLMARSFEDATGVDVDMTRKSSGETFAQIKAEEVNPRGDVWWGGTGDPHLQAAEEGLTAAYVSPMREQLHPWAIAQHKPVQGVPSHAARSRNRLVQQKRPPNRHRQSLNQCRQSHALRQWPAPLHQQRPLHLRQLQRFAQIVRDAQLPPIPRQLHSHLFNR